MAWAPAALSIGSSIFGGIMSAQGQKAGSQAEAQAAQQAAGQINAATSQASANFQPYIQEGSSAANLLQQQLPTLSQNFNPTVAQLDATPGFQFMNQQGEQAIESQMAQNGLIGSGAEGKALANYATQNALSNYGTLANIYNQGRQISLKGLLGASGLGSTAANNLGNILLTGAQAAGGLTAQAGKYIGQGIAGSANALGQIPANAFGAASSTTQFENQYGNPLASLFGGGGGGSPFSMGNSVTPQFVPYGGGSAGFSML